MDKTWKRKWVKALRSGEYIQGTGTLCQYDREQGSLTFCCLGVLTDIVDPDSWEGEDDLRNSRLSNIYYGNEQDNHIPAAITMVTALEDGYQRALVNLNDTKGMTFNEIADWIESHPDL